MNILLISPLPPPLGGMGIWTRTLLDYYKNNNEIFFYKVDTSPRWRKIYQTNKILRAFGGGIQLISNLVSVLRFIFKVDCCHLCTSGSLALIRDRCILRVCKIFKKPCIYHIHYGRIPQIENDNTAEWKILKKNIKLAKIILPLEKKTEDVLRKYCSNVFRLPNPIKIENISQEKNTKTVTFVGWNIISKGIEDLLEAWQYIDNHYIWKLQVIGPGDVNYINTLKNHYKCKNVVFLGEQEHDKVLDYMKTSDIFILPSHTEAFPLVVLEAMSIGVAVIGTEVGAIPEMLSDNCGIVIKPKAPKQIKEALIKFIENDELRNICGINAKKKIQKEYCTNIVFPKLETIWKNCVQKLY